MEVTEHSPGTFCWAELGTSDAEGAKQFYTSLFGWEYVDHEMGEGMGAYTMLTLRGKSVGALFHDTHTGAPPHWNTYVRVPSADESAAQAKSLGGNVMGEPFDVFDVGRMAVIQDPTGAVLCAWQPRKHIGAEIIDEVGAFCWYELYTRDTQKAKSFYTSLFSWGTKPFGESYTMFTVGEKSVGGMMAITPEMGDIPPNWLPYVHVADCDSTVEQARSLGGQALMPSMDIPNIGRFAVIQDPQKAVIAVITLV